MERLRAIVGNACDVQQLVTVCCYLSTTLDSVRHTEHKIAEVLFFLFLKICSFSLLYFSLDCNYNLIVKGFSSVLYSLSLIIVSPFCETNETELKQFLE